MSKRLTLQQLAVLLAFDSKEASQRFMNYEVFKIWDRQMSKRKPPKKGGKGC